MSSETTQSDYSVMEHSRSFWSDSLHRLLREKGSWVCLAIIILYALLAIGAGVYDALAAANPDDSFKTFQESVDYNQTDCSPSFKNGFWDILGTDSFGRSVLAKTIIGAKVSLWVALMANIIAIPLGMLLGAIAGYYGRWFDAIIVWLYSTLASIPGLILLIALTYAFKGVSLWGIKLTGLNGIIIALSVTGWIGTCRLVRAETMKLREMDYVIAARACGTGRFKILLKHVIPNVFHIGIINFSLGFVGAIKAEVMLTFLGLGPDVGTPSWGGMINEARMSLYAGQWWQITSAVVAMFIIVLAWSIFGDRLRDAMDPKLKNVS